MSFVDVRVRFAPSPTGFLHVGGARTALYNYLFAKKMKGTFILRIEDTDRERSTLEAEKAIMEDLEWLGLLWDEGPYRQTERLSLYKEHALDLLKRGLAYKCYCTESEIEEMREEMLLKGIAPRYNGRCRDLSEEERERFEKEGRKPAIRFKVPGDGEITFEDIVRGHFKFSLADIGDFVIMRSDGIPTYNFAVVIDDHYMGITHVIRADEHIANTPKQLLLYEAFGWKPPQFAHVSMILGPDRSKLSKRHGAVAISQYRRDGYIPEAMNNYLLLLGWSSPDDREIFSMEEMIEAFSLDRLSKSPAVFDIGKLTWMNGHYMRSLPLEKIYEYSLPFFLEKGFSMNEEWLKKVVFVYREHTSTLREMVEEALPLIRFSLPFSSDVEEVLEGEDVPKILEAFLEVFYPFKYKEVSSSEIWELLKEVVSKVGLKRGKVLFPLRVAITGRRSGPELYYIIELIGIKEALRRVQEVLSYIKGK
ncbi:MAG: nondiscriminating glutamyl-tRNA synthetase [bacterium]|nr:nondiscriminating glutamyl-tRNA synthetase [bacterium]